MNTVTKKQITIIHVLKNELGMDDDMYRSYLENFGVCSAKELSREGAGELITSLKMCSGSRQGDADAWKYKRKPKETKRYSHLKKGRGFGAVKATPAQLYLIEKLWKIGSRSGTDRSLRAMLKRLTKTEKLEWINKKQASTMIVSLHEIAVKALRKRWGVLTSQDMNDSIALDEDLIRLLYKTHEAFYAGSLRERISTLMPKHGKEGKKGRVADATEIIAIAELIGLLEEQS